MDLHEQAQGTILNFLKGKKGEQKAGAKYLKREWVGKRWKYTYKEPTEKNQSPKTVSLLEKIASYFKTDSDSAKSKPKSEYEAHGIKEKGISLPEWTSHFAKYFQRKSEYDAKFNQEKTAKTSGSKIIDSKEKTEIKEENSDPKSKTIYKKSIFKTLFELYGDKNGNSDTGRSISGNPSDGLANPENIPTVLDLRNPSGNLQTGRETDNTGKPSEILGDTGPGLGDDVRIDKRVVKHIGLDSNGQKIYSHSDFKDHAEMIQFLIDQESGTIQNAFSNPKIGSIDLLWGDEKHGLKHLILRRNSEGVDIKRFLKDLPLVLEKGEVTTSKVSEKKKLVYLEDKGSLAIVGLEYNGDSRNWVVSAFKISKKERVARMSVDPSGYDSSGAITSIEAGVQEEGSKELVFEELGENQAKNLDPNALSKAMEGNQNAKKDSPTFQLIQESAPEPKGFQQDNNLFGITPQTERKILNTAYQPKIQPIGDTKSIPELITLVKDTLLKEGLDKKAEEWVHQAYSSDAKSINELLNLAYKYVSISSEDSNKIRKNLKSVEHQKNVEQTLTNIDKVQEKFSQKKQYEINQKCKEILASTLPADITEEQKEILRLYEGSGGQSTNEAMTEEEKRGLLYQFFTPRKMISKVQDIMARYLKPGDSGLEPSAGIGRFAEDKGSQYKWDMLEYNPEDNTAYQIARILHPEAGISDQAFETLFVDKKNRSVGQNYQGKKYKFISGNPPYGDMDGKYKAIEGKGWDRYEHYFIHRGLDTLEEGGTLFYVVPSSFLQAGPTAWKKKIFGKAELLEAYRMPEGSFGNTQMAVDVIVLRKNTTGTQDNSNAFNGKYFEENPDKVFGDILERKNRFGRLENYVKGKADAFYNSTLPAPKEMSQAQKDAISLGLMGNDNAKGKRKAEIAEEVKKVNKTAVKKQEIVDVVKLKKPIPTYSQDEFNSKFNAKFSEKDIALVKDTSPTGRIKDSVPFDSETMAILPDGSKTPLYLYKAGNIKDKITELENSKEDFIAQFGEKQFESQRKLLESVLPKKITVDKITLTPIEPFAKGMLLDTEDGLQTTLIQRFKTWIRGTRVERGYGRRKRVEYVDGLDPNILDGYEITFQDIIDYVDGQKVTGRNQIIEGVKQDTNKQRKEQRKAMGNKLFLDFIRTVLSPEEKAQLEKEWNDTYNTDNPLDGKEIPLLLDGMSKTYKGKEQDPRNIQLEFAAKFMAKGVGCATHEVGLGKTWTGMMCTVSSMQSGKTKKPLIVVPTSVLQKWYMEFQERFPGVPVQMVGTPQLNKALESGNGKYIPPDGTVTIMSYDAFGQFGFTEDTYLELTKDVQDQIDDPAIKDLKGKTKNRAEAQALEKAGSKLSLAVKGTSNQLNFDEAGFDFLTVDEAHNFNNIFVDQESGKNRFNKGNPDDSITKEDDGVNEYEGLTGGTPSSRGWKFWLASQYVQKRNDNRNVLLLTATPFTNNPLQVYSLLSAIGREKLQARGINSVRDFLGAFVESAPETVVEGNGKVRRKNVVRSWKNAHAFQELIREFFDYQSGDKNGVKRPKLKMKAVTIPLSDEMVEMRNQLEFLYDAVDADEKPIPGAPLVSIGTQQLMNISPALVKRGNAEVWAFAPDINPLGNKQFVERSPKLKYICDSIAGFYNAYQEAKPGDPIPGQLFFLPKGVEYMPEIKKYLVETKGIPPEAIEFLDTESKGQKALDPEMKAKGLSRFTEITKDFNNKNGKCKIIIGSDVIKEGVSLNKHTAVAYNSMIDWNPTTEVQKRGRHHRPGNEFGECMWVDVLMEDSIDSKLYQKQGEKISRINQVFEGKGDTAIDISDINPDELKLDLIRDPERKARVYVAEQIQKLLQKSREKQSIALTFSGMSDKYESYTATIQSETEDLQKAEAEIAEILNAEKEKGRTAKETTDYLTQIYRKGYGAYGDAYWKAREFFEAKDSIAACKKNIAEATRKRERILYQMKSRGVTPQNINEKAEKFQKEADELYEEKRSLDDSENRETLKKQFESEIAEREKKKVKEPLDKMVQDQVADVLEMLGIKKIQKSISMKPQNLVAKARITIFNFLKSENNASQRI